MLVVVLETKARWYVSPVIQSVPVAGLVVPARGEGTPPVPEFGGNISPCPEAAQVLMMDRQVMMNS